MSADPQAALPGLSGVLGIGNMGLALALRLRDAGWPVRVHDLDAARMALAEQAGASLAGSPEALARGCERLFVVVVDAAQTEQVLFGEHGAAAALASGACVLLCPTIGPTDVQSLAARLDAIGLGCIDAPMSGGPARARDGTMSLMVACTDALFAQQQPVLRQIAGRLFRVGSRPGDGARTKLVNNLLAALNLAGAAEALALAERLGLDARTTLAVIGESSGQSWIGGDRLPRALDGDFAPRAHTTLLAKDSALAVAMAAQAGLRPTLGVAAATLFQAALAAGHGGDDDARMLTLMRSLIAAPGPATGPGPDPDRDRPGTAEPDPPAAG